MFPLGDTGGNGVRSKEPFRSLLEEARAADHKAPAAPVAAPSPVPLAQRLDQLVLAGGTPARGTLMPPLDGTFGDTFGAPRGDAPARHTATDDLFAALDMAGEPTRPLPACADRSPADS